MADSRLGQSLDIGRELEQEKQAEKQQQPEQPPDGQQKTQEEPTAVTAEKNSEQPAPATDEKAEESPEVPEITIAEEVPKPVDPLEEDINAILTKSELAKSVYQKRFSFKTFVLVLLLFVLSIGILWWFISPDNPVAMPDQDIPVLQASIVLAVPNYTIAEQPLTAQPNDSAVGADDVGFLLAGKLKD